MNACILPEAIQPKSLLKDLSTEELRSLAKKDETTTKYGSAVYITQVRSRSAKKTYVVLDEGIEIGVRQQGIPPEKAYAVIRDVHEYLKRQEVIQIDRQMGLHPDFALLCRLLVTKSYARLGYIWQKSLFSAPSKQDPQLVTIYVPEWPERLILVQPERGFTYILGTDYFGEAKKSFLRIAMYRTKQKGGLGLHAGAKLLRLKDSQGQLKESGFLLFGLSGTGKTTLTLHNHHLSGAEEIVIRQDDVVMMNGDGYCFGTEDGFFIKTEGLDPSQEVLYYAATRPSAAFENVKVKEDGELDFLNYDLTTNGRGLVLRKDIANTDDKIDLPQADKIIFITRRNDIVPVVAKLNPVQAAAFFMLGESIETSAGDPAKAGQAKREVGTNPFIIGSEAQEGNRLKAILTKNCNLQCYLLNTGSIGKGPKSAKGEKITIKTSTTIMKEIGRGSIEWKQDPDWKYEVPVKIPGIDLDRYSPKGYYSESEYRQKTAALREDRLRWLKQFSGLDSDIVEAIG